MYIEDRLFSENNPEEVLYSVTMTETEYALYSEFQRLYSKTGKIQDLGKKLWKKVEGPAGNYSRAYYKLPSLPGQPASEIPFARPYWHNLPKGVRKTMIKGNGHFKPGVYGEDMAELAKRVYLGK